MYFVPAWCVFTLLNFTFACRNFCMWELPTAKKSGKGKCSISTWYQKEFFSLVNSVHVLGHEDWRTIYFGLCLFLAVRGHVITSRIMSTGPLATLLMMTSDQASHFFVHQSIQWSFSSEILNLMLKVSFTICWFQWVSCPIVSWAQLSFMTFHPIFMAKNLGVSLLTVMMRGEALTFFYCPFLCTQKV